MKAILPVAGVGSRLRPFTLTKPKALIPLVGRPIISYIIDSLIEIGVNEIIFVIGYLGEEIKEYVKYEYNNRDFKPIFVFQEERQGLAHAVYMAKEELKKEEDDIIIILGDTIIDTSLKKIIDSNFNGLGVKEVTNPHRFGIVEIDENDMLIDLEEKPEHPKTNLALVGLYYFKSSFKLLEGLEYIINNDIKVRGEYQLTSVIEHLLKEGEAFKIYRVNDWIDCGDFDSLREANNYFLNKLDSKYKIDEKNNTIYIPPYYVGEGSVIKNSIIGPFVSIGKGSVIEDSIIKNSIISENATIKRYLLNKSIIGEEAKLIGKHSSLNLSDHAQIVNGVNEV